ncbi:MAG TPA: MFS transporter, partial [Candidatus Limnocylindrales bacterium]|nr:MFS transporter [Candidatus Limnocylindrales bacterium]
VLRLSVTIFLIQAGFHAFTVSIPLALDRAGRPDADIGAIVGLAALVQIPAALVGGVLIDRFGSMKLILVGGLSYIAATVFLILPGLAPETSTLEFIAARILQGLGFGMVMPAALSFVPRLVPVAKRGIALAMASTSHNLTLVFVPPMSVIVLDGAGLTGVALFAGVAVTAALVIAFARPFGARESGEDAEHHQARRLLGFAFRRAWVMPLAIIGLFDIHWGVVTAYLPQRAEAADADIGLFFAADGLLVLLTRMPAGWLADRAPSSWQIIAGVVATFVGIALILPAPTTPILILSGALTGAGAALIIVPINLALTRRSNDADRGSAFALFSAIFAAGIALGSIGTAPLIDVVGYEVLLGASLVALIAAIGVTLLDRDLGSVPVSAKAEESVAATPAGG